MFQQHGYAIVTISIRLARLERVIAIALVYEHMLLRRGPSALETLSRLQER